VLSVIADVDGASFERRQRRLGIAHSAVLPACAARSTAALQLQVGVGAASKQHPGAQDSVRQFQHVTDRNWDAPLRFYRCMMANPAPRWVICGVGVMARRPPNDGASWSARELKTLKALAKSGTPTGQVAKKLGRTAAAVQQKAMRAGISFRAAKRSGARRKK
jgi:hypothetical protein